MRIEKKEEVEKRILKKTGLNSVKKSAVSPKISLSTDSLKDFEIWRERLILHRKGDANIKKFYSESMSKYEIGKNILKNLRISKSKK